MKIKQNVGLVTVRDDELPPYLPGMAVRCPTHHPDGRPIADSDIPGCGSADVGWDGSEMYDCYECGIFFAPFAADPPHRRFRDSD